jgi:hypothetical protein
LFVLKAAAGRSLRDRNYHCGTVTQALREAWRSRKAYV